MGWDAFGLPAENYAIKNKVHPRVAVEHNIQNFKKQLSNLGFNYDWSREINTTDPEYYKWYSIREFTYNGITQYNRNKLLWRDKSVDGVKTGHTDSAGYCLVTSALKDDMRLIAIVLGTDSALARVKDSQALINYGFRFFESHKLYQAGITLANTRIWKGSRKNLALGLKEPLYITVPKGRYDQIDAELVIDSKITAPVSKGQQLGLAQVKLAGEPLQQYPLIALEAVTEGSFWTRISDEALLYFQ